MPNLNLNAFVRPSVPPTSPITIEDFVRVLKGHVGLFVVDNIKYDNVLYCGKDNIYFSYCFNYNNGKAINETLLIMDNILISDTCFIVSSQGRDYVISLQE